MSCSYVLDAVQSPPCRRAERPPERGEVLPVNDAGCGGARVENNFLAAVAAAVGAHGCDVGAELVGLVGDVAAPENRRRGCGARTMSKTPTTTPKITVMGYTGLLANSTEARVISTPMQSTMSSPPRIRRNQVATGPRGVMSSSCREVDQDARRRKAGAELDARRTIDGLAH